MRRLGVIVGLLVFAFALGGSHAFAQSSAKPKPCKPTRATKTKPAKKCPVKKKVVPKPAPTPVPAPTPAPTPTPTPPAPPAGATYEFAAGVSADDQALVRAAIDLGFRYAQRFGVAAIGFTVAVDSEAGTILANGPKISVHTGNEAWLRLSAPRRMEIVVHEFFHVVQLALSGRSAGGRDDEVPAAGARWLIEGAAEWFGYSALADAGQLDFGVERSRFVAGARASNAPLSSLETWAGMTAASPYHYAVSFTAVDFATRNGGIQSLVAVWREMGAGKAWRDAFAAVYGKSLDAFYAEFESYRQTL